MAGTANFKPAYAPDFPEVRIVEARPGLTVTPDELAAMNVLAPEAPAPPPLPFVASTTGPRTQKWPDYAQCLERAPVGSSGNPKRTSADFVFCKIALSWGHGIEETAARLLEVSSKAQENGEAYARKTAERAEYAARVRNAGERGPKPR